MNLVVYHLNRDSKHFIRPTCYHSSLHKSKHLGYPRYWFKCFTCINVANPYNNLLLLFYYPYIFPFYISLYKEAKADRILIIWNGVAGIWNQIVTLPESMFSQPHSKHPSARLRESLVCYQRRSNPRQVSPWHCLSLQLQLPHFAINCTFVPTRVGSSWRQIFLLYYSSLFPVCKMDQFVWFFLWKAVAGDVRVTQEKIWSVSEEPTLLSQDPWSCAVTGSITKSELGIPLTVKQTHNGPFMTQT